jgi:hypothetical protein
VHNSQILIYLFFEVFFLFKNSLILVKGVHKTVNSDLLPLFCFNKIFTSAFVIVLLSLSTFAFPLNFIHALPILPASELKGMQQFMAGIMSYENRYCKSLDQFLSAECALGENRKQQLHQIPKIGPLLSCSLNQWLQNQCSINQLFGNNLFLNLGDASSLPGLGTIKGSLSKNSEEEPLSEPSLDDLSTETPSISSQTPSISSQTPFIPKPSLLNNPFFLSPGERSILGIEDPPILAQTKDALTRSQLKEFGPMVQGSLGAVDQALGVLNLNNGPGSSLSSQLANPINELRLLGEVDTPEEIAPNLSSLPMPEGSDPLGFRELVFGENPAFTTSEPSLPTTTPEQQAFAAESNPNPLATTTPEQQAFAAESNPNPLATTTPEQPLYNGGQGGGDAGEGSYAGAGQEGSYGEGQGGGDAGEGSDD